MTDPGGLVLLGGGGTAREIIELVSTQAGSDARARIIAVLDDDPKRHGTRLDSIPITGPLASARRFPPETRFVDALGSPRNYFQRPALIERLGIPSSRFATLIHPTAVISPTALIGPGSIVLALAVVGAGATVGGHVTLLPGAVVSHDADIGDWSLLATKAVVSGGARINRCCYVGAGAMIIDGCRVGEGALVGMGSVVIHDVPPSAIVAGNPARVMRMREEHP